MISWGIGEHVVGQHGHFVPGDRSVQTLSTVLYTRQSDGIFASAAKKMKMLRGRIIGRSPIVAGRSRSRMLAGFLLQQLSVLLILATTIFVLYNFWRASTPYGDIQESIRKKSISQTLAAYLCIAAIFLFFEFISLIWTMTRVRVRENGRTIKEDTGRGLFSFLLVFITSYLCFLFSHFLPDSPEIIYGIKGAFDVYGSLHNALLGLCAAGVISCLIRRHMS